MGANVRDGIAAGEYWRIFSSAFLHIGFVHLALSVYAILVFAPFLERLYGRAPVLILFGISAFGAGVLGALIRESEVAAGASGPVWGFMCAGVAAAARTRGMLMDDALKRLRKRAWPPVALNFVHSFVLGVEPFANLGGGLLGAFLILTGLIGGKRKSPLRAASEEGSAAVESWMPASAIRGRPTRIAAAALLLFTMFSSILAALVNGRPWELRWLPPSERITLSSTSVSIEVPRALQSRTGSNDGATRNRDYFFGKPVRDPLAVYVNVTELETEMSPEGAAEFLEQVRIELQSELTFPTQKPDHPEGTSVHTPPELKCVADWPATYRESEFEDGLRVGRQLSVRKNQLLTLEIAATPPLPEVWIRAKDAIFESLRVQGESAFTDADRTERLLQAAMRGTRPGVRFLADCGVDLNAGDPAGSTALIVASANGRDEFVKDLLVFGADVNGTTNDGESALGVAARQGHLLVVEVLLKAGAQVDARDKLGFTALMWAAGNGYLDVVRKLLAAGADVTLQAHDGTTASSFASENGHHAVVRVLGSAGGA
jgi:hypothetical protein